MEFVTDEEYRAMLLETLGVEDPADPFNTADIPELEAACVAANLDLPIVNRQR